MLVDLILVTFKGTSIFFAFLALVGFVVDLDFDTVVCFFSSGIFYLMLLPNRALQR